MTQEHTDYSEDIQRKFQDLFDLEMFKDVEVHVIGVGATGSHITKSLCRYGFTIHIYDFDKVETKNTYNQYYRIGDLGKQKVYALAERLLEESSISKVVPHNEKVTDASNMNGIIITTVDSVDSRKDIGLTLKEFDFLLDPGIPMNVENFLLAAGRVRVVLPDTINEWLEYYGDDTDESMKARVLETIKGCEAQQYSLLCEDVAIQTCKVLVSLLYCKHKKVNLSFSKGYVVSGAMPSIVNQNDYN